MLRNLAHSSTLVTACYVAISQAVWCQPASPSRTDTAYPVVDSRTLTFGTDPKFFWISDDELLFVSLKKTTDSSAPAGERLSHAITRWNTKTGTLRELRRFGENRPDICYHDGVFLYGVRRNDGGTELYYGTLDQPDQPVDAKQYGFLFCRRSDSSPKFPNWTEGREIRLLEKFGAGFVDFGESKNWTENTAVRLYRYNMKQGEGVQLPFGRRDIKPKFPYYSFKSAFFVESMYPHFPRPKEIPYPVYWLYSDGKVEKIGEIPWGPWRARASLWIVPTRVGLVIGSHNARGQDIADAGLYLLHGSKVEKILSGWIQGTQVSTDGCRIAYSFTPIPTDKNQVLRAMNLCKRMPK